MQRSFDLDAFLAAALAEDLGPDDVTSLAVIPEGAQARFVLVAREKLVVAGLEFMPQLFALIDSRVQVLAHVRDGEQVEAKTKLATLSGPARALLAGERTALNVLQHLSGVATLTRAYVDAVEGTGVRILDTRKTIPGLRFLQKYAVAMGGGLNHRMGLYDAVLIKDNHLAVAGSVKKAVDAARAAQPAMKIEVECDTLKQLEEAVAAKADIVLLDNMPQATLKKAAALARKAGIATEASGGVSLKTVRAIAGAGVDLISVGGLTHSAPAVDIGLDEI